MDVLLLCATRPDKCLRDDHSLTVERNRRAAMKTEPNVESLADPAAERVVVWAGQDTVSW